MKKLITLLCCLPFLSFAQKNEIALNGGVSFNTNYLTTTFYRTTASPSIYYSFGYARRFGNWQLGIKYARHKMKAALNQTLTMATPSGMQPNPKYKEGKIESQSAVAMVLYVNRLLTINKHQFYGGVHGGLYTASNKLCAGVQLGDTYYIKKWLGINIETGVYYYDIGYETVRFGNYVNTHKDVLAFPLALGIRFRF